VRVQEAHDHEERPALLAQLRRVVAQPAHALAGKVGVVVEAPVGRAGSIAIGVENVEPVGLERLAGVDRFGAGPEKIQVEFKFAKVSGQVAQQSQEPAHVGLLRS
jgi:hypothetical protein